MRRSGSWARRLSIAGRELATFRPSRQWLVGVLRSFLVSFAALAVTLWILPGEQVPDNGAAAVALLVVTVLVVGALLRPFLTLLSVLTGGLGLLVAGLVAQSLVLGVALALVPAIEPVPLPQVLLLAIGVAAVAALLNWVVDSSTEEVFLAQVLGRAIRVSRAYDETGPGLLVVQLDGVAEPLLRQASQSGAVPFLTRMLRSGDHRLRTWHTGLPSTTPAGQAVLLHGDATAIPAFRWFDKERGRVLECSRPADAAEIEADFTTGRGLLADGGVSVANLFSGDAPVQALTMSHARIPGTDRGAAAFVTSRTGFLRAVVLLIGQIVTEWHQGRRQRRRNVVPRVSRGGAFVFLRGLTTVVLRDLSVAIVADQMARGAPVVYVDLLDYDEVAHHAGPTRPESMRTLEGLDRVAQFFAQLSEEVGRDYEIVVLSDHGQTQGSTFLQLEGRSLADAVDDILECPSQHDRRGAPAETLGPANVLHASGHRSLPLLRRVTRRAPDPQPSPAPAPPETSRVRVVSSGSIAHLYLVDVPGRLAREDVDALLPALLPGLLALDHVGLVVTRSATGAVLVADRDGHRELTAVGAVGGSGPDPLSAYGPKAASDLLALDAKQHVGDVVLLGRYDPALGEVAAFEELVGSHGGLGGAQTEAMLVHPADWAVPPGDLDGLTVHRLLLERLEHLGLRRTTAGADAPTDALQAAGG